MALVDDSAYVAAELRQLFAEMDAGDEAGTVRAMNEAAKFLRQHDLSFRQVVQQIEARGLLLPSKVGAAIQLMDSTTLSEAESALTGARRLMRGCGLTFEHIIAALEHEPAEADEIEKLRRAFQFEVEKSRKMAAELRIFREQAPASGFDFISMPIKNFVLVVTLLFGLWLAASVVTTITGLFRSTNATATKYSPATVAQRHDDEPILALPPPAVSNCWRVRSIRGPCF